MNTSTHTPGPWSVNEIDASGEPSADYIFIEPGVAVIERKVAGSDECDMPDAHLIAAAPAMLSTLRTIHGALEALGDHANLQRLASAAIAQATGSRA